jgi:hypothetical protein
MGKKFRQVLLQMQTVTATDSPRNFVQWMAQIGLILGLVETSLKLIFKKSIAGNYVPENYLPTS